MFISIIIPTYNRPHFLAECLAAISGQAAGDSAVEVHVVDDGSAPASARANSDLCTRHGAGYQHLPENRGMAVARNAGIDRSTGEWLVFIDDDFRIADDWLTNAKTTLSKQPESIVGVEGRIDAAGEGLWDREVQSHKGGLYLTCHIAYRRYVVEMLHGFDPAFEFKGPFCEDHEIAARILRYGDIVFEPELRGVHLPRRIALIPYILSSFRRVRTLLAAEYYFFCKQGDWYHRFRHSRTFWGTFASILIRNLLNNLRRRNIADSLRHPLQLLTLVAASLLEQIGAWLLIPRYLVALIENRPCFFHRLIDERRTCDLWQFRDTAAVMMLRLRFSLVNSLFFPLIQKPVYDIRPLLKRLRTERVAPDCRLLLRIDDVFLGETAAMQGLLRVMEAKKYPFLAGVKGDDLVDPASVPIINRLRETGAEIAVHGFSHSGQFGPFASELLQMNYAQILNRLVAVSGAPVFRNNPPLAFMPPFNAVSGEQISFLAHHFAVVTGGSETMRFSDHFAGPVAMTGGGWYVPTVFPYYNTAARILRAGLAAGLSRTSGFVCLALHMSEEAKDGFAGFARLLDALPFPPVSWRIFTKENSGASYFNTSPENP